MFKYFVSTCRDVAVIQGIVLSRIFQTVLLASVRSGNRKIVCALCMALNLNSQQEVAVLTPLSPNRDLRATRLSGDPFLCLLLLY